jgi:hypothetical protein
MTQQSELPTKKPLLFHDIACTAAISIPRVRNGVASELEAGAVPKQMDEHLPAQKEPVLEYDEELDPTRPITLAGLR